jgi:hypothetical protein
MVPIKIFPLIMYETVGVGAEEFFLHKNFELIIFIMI